MLWLKTADGGGATTELDVGAGSGAAGVVGVSWLGTAGGDDASVFELGDGAGAGTAGVSGLWLVGAGLATGGTEELGASAGGGATEL